MIEATVLYYEKEPTHGMKIIGYKKYLVHEDDVRELQELCLANGWKLETKGVHSTSLKVIEAEVRKIAQTTGQ